MRYWITRLSHPLGLRYTFLHDFAVRFEVVVFGIICIPAVHFLFGLLSAYGFLLLLFCWFFIIVVEIQNTAIEVALTKLHPEHDKAMGLSKDQASGAVIWAFLFGVICLGFVVSGKI